MLKQHSDPHGRFIVIDISSNEKVITLVNLYAPNHDDPDLFQKVLDVLSDFTCDDITLMWRGFQLDPGYQTDKKGGIPKTHSKVVKKLREATLNLDLTDMWRDMHPDERRFTWRQSKPEIRCRLDFFLISPGLNPHVLATDINPGHKTDHSLITLSVNLVSNPRGPGYWIPNTSFLGEDEYVNLIKATITEVQEEYKHDQSVDDSLLWETVQLKVRHKSIYYAKKKKEITHIQP